jgi:hypothetical protein
MSNLAGDQSDQKSTLDFIVIAFLNVSPSGVELYAMYPPWVSQIYLKPIRHELTELDRIFAKVGDR